MWKELKNNLVAGDIKSLARCVSLVENEFQGFEDFMKSLPVSCDSKVIGITGPPGAGKSTLTDALIDLLITDKRKVAVLCIDPSSPFNHGALLGDRIRMNHWHNHSNVFIRSLSTRASLGGLNPKTIEITEILKAAHYDYIIIETVGVGQNEVEIAGLADLTVVVLVPEAGDDIQTMKAGLMEVADVFVVNKSDRNGADTFIKHLKQMLSSTLLNKKNETPIIQTIADQKKGIDDLKEIIFNFNTNNRELRKWLLVEKIYQLIQKQKMSDVDKLNIFEEIQKSNKKINLYKFIENYNK